MAARPNALRTIEYGQRLVANHLGRLESMLEMVTTALAENKTLTPEDIAGYKACLNVGKKQLTQFTKLSEIEVPSIHIPASRKRGRPSQSELEQLAVARGEKKATKLSVNGAASKAVTTPAPVAEGPKKRGRKPKITATSAVAATSTPAVTHNVTDAPKRRGRPPKVKTLEATAANTDIDSDTQPTAAPKKRGRTPKAESLMLVAAQNSPAIDDAPIKKKLGRPKGSKNKASLNGHNSDTLDVN